MRDIKRNIRPLVLKDKDSDISYTVSLLLFSAFWVGFYPLILKLGQSLCRYCNFCLVIAFVMDCISYLINPDKNKVVFRIDENGVYFHDEHDRKSHSFEWSKLKEVSVKTGPIGNGKRARLLFITTQDATEYRFNIFYFVFSYFWTMHRLRECVNFYSKGSVSFKCNNIWDKFSQ